MSTAAQSIPVSPSTLTHSTTIRNGIDTAALAGAAVGIRDNPANGQTRWAIASRWVGGTRSDHDVSSYELAGKEIPRSFTIRVDEPHELCGTNRYANPQEYLLAALNACMIVGFSAVAALAGIAITRLEIRTEGDIDLRGFLGLEPAIKPGYPYLTQTIHITADASPHQLRQLHDVVKSRSPNFFNLVNAIPVDSRLVIE